MNYSLIILASDVLRFLVIHTAKAVTTAKAGVSYAHWNVQKGGPNRNHSTKSDFSRDFWNVKTHSRASLHATRL